MEYIISFFNAKGQEEWAYKKSTMLWENGSCDTESEEEQTTQWLKEKVQKDKKRLTYT